MRTPPPAAFGKCTCPPIRFPVYIAPPVTLKSGSFFVGRLQPVNPDSNARPGKTPYSGQVKRAAPQQSDSAFPSRDGAPQDPEIHLHLGAGGHGPGAGAPAGRYRHSAEIPVPTHSRRRLCLHYQSAAGRLVRSVCSQPAPLERQYPDHRGVPAHAARVFQRRIHPATANELGHRPGAFPAGSFFEPYGLLLPWDQLAYWAITISTSMLAYIPGAGEWLQQMVMGGPERPAAW